MTFALAFELTNCYYNGKSFDIDGEVIEFDVIDKAEDLENFRKRFPTKHVETARFIPKMYSELKRKKWK